MNEQAPTSSFMRFWTSIPGILTAAAAVITAVGTIYVATLNRDPSNGQTQGGTTTVVTSTVAAPAPTTAVDVGQLQLDNVTDASSGEAGVESMIRDCADGDAHACIQILETLSDDCYAGDGLSCDVLYELSPIGSTYEAYGATCGGRVSAAYADRCRSL